MPCAVYEEFLKPTLLIALFAPPEELSAGVVLGAFYFYTLAHQSDFDVCWCKVPARSAPPCAHVLTLGRFAAPHAG